MQCILTRTDYELYFGGENIASEQPQSFTCPYCSRMGFTEATLLEHISEHTDTGLEVVCPICAATPQGDPNLVTDDLAGHLSLEHRGTRDLISFLDEPSGIRHGGIRRMPHSGRALGGPRSRRSNMQFSSSGGGLSTLSPSGRESVDPIAELLQQLSGVRRGAPQPSQLQQLQMQIQMERQQVSAARQQLERLPRRQGHSSSSMATSSSSNANGLTSTSSQSSTVVNITGNNFREPAIASLSATAAAVSGTSSVGGTGGGTQPTQTSSITEFQFLLTKIMDGLEKKSVEQQRIDAANFTSDVILGLIDLHEDPTKLATEAIEKLLEDERLEKEKQKQEEIDKRREAARRRMAEQDKQRSEQQKQQPQPSATTSSTTGSTTTDAVDIESNEKPLPSGTDLLITSSSESTPDRELTSDSTEISDRISQGDIAEDLDDMGLSATPRERVSNTTKKTTLKGVRPKTQTKPPTARQNSDNR